MQSLYLAYNDECDSARANHVRKHVLGTGDYQVEGYLPFTTWSKTKLGCSTEEIKRSIEDGLSRASAAIILIGPDAAANPWIRYVIEWCYANHKPMFAVYIHEIPDEHGNGASADLNPLERFAVMENGAKIYLCDRYQTITWSDDDTGAFYTALADACAKNAAQEASQRIDTAARTFEGFRPDETNGRPAVPA